MTQEHPITPPEELVDQWNEAWIDAKVKHEGLVTFIATQAALWGADQELNACCEWIYKLMDRGLEWSMDLRASRRPNPPSLKEQALAALSRLNSGALCANPVTDKETIRRALESLPD